MNSSRGNNSWTDLNEALLDNIFALVCSPLEDSGPEIPYRLQSNFPLVCRRWNDAYKKSPTLWRRVELNWATAINPPGLDRRHLSSWAEERNTPYSYPTNDSSEIPRFGYICRWLSTRAPLIEHLTFTNCHVLGPTLELQLISLCSQASRLVTLQLLDYKGSGDEVLAALQSTNSKTPSSSSSSPSSPSLRAIKLTCYQPTRGHTIPLRISGSAVRDLVNKLPMVESVDLEIDSLVSISNTEWSKLEKLTSFRLLGRMESVVLHPEMLSALKNLQKLDLVHVRLPQFSPAMVAALSKVSFLSLKNILAAKPRRKSGFTLWNALPGLKSLKELEVIGAGRDAELPRSALACSALQRLSIRDCSHVGHWPLQNSTLAITNSVHETSCPALDILQHLSLANVGLATLPSATFWGHCRSLTSLTWFNVHHAAPRHRYWDHGGACELTNAMEHVLRMLRVLCLEFSGMNEEQLMLTVEALHSAVKLKELSLRGNRLGSVHGSEIANAIIHDKIELDSLSLVNCGLSKVPADIFSLSSLTKLDLSNNPRLETSKEEDRKLDKIKVVKRNDRKAMLLASLPTFRMGGNAQGIALGV